MGCSIEMPKYVCHKEVWALKIANIVPAQMRLDSSPYDGKWLLIPEDKQYGPIEVDHLEYYVKHKPQAGGYYVQYKGGYESYSPADAFEEGYTRKTPVETLNARKATVIREIEIEALIQAKRLTRPRLTPADIDATIKAETYTTLPSGKVMVCELTLCNGFTVRGEAAVVSKGNFNEEIGRKISRENARSKVWELEGYLLQQRLYEDVVEEQATKLP
jgi:hypothetical protein